jgi:hypothetical protein
MKLWILKGFHYSNFIPSIKIARNKLKLTRKFTFNESCMYRIEEDSCINKLFGFSFGLFGVHKNSVRFGWKYDTVNFEIDIYRYVYRDGILRKSLLHFVEFDEEFTVSFEFERLIDSSWNIAMYINDEFIGRECFGSNLPKLLLTLGFYFGGNSRAPHTMHIQSKKV